MKKIAITGSGGAGKTILARQLQRILKVDIVHMDSLFWKEGWIPTTEAERKQKLEPRLQKESWIIEGDGDYSSIELIYDLRFAAADTIVWLDLPRSVCLWRVLKRAYETKNSDRFDLPPGCQEDWKSEGFRQFLKRVWNYSTEYRPLVQEKINNYYGEKRVFILRTAMEVEDFVATISCINALSNSATPKRSQNTAGRQTWVPSVATS